MEHFIPQERPIGLDKNREIYTETLKLKRDVLASHNEMNVLRRKVNERIEKMTDEEFANDPEVVMYKNIHDEYDKRRRAFLTLFEKLSDEDKEKIRELTSLKKIEAEPPSMDKEKPTAEMPKEEMSEAEIDRMIEYAKNTARPFIERSYWGAKKAELKKKRKAESEKDEMTEAEIDKMLKYSKDTGRIIELSYWEERKTELQNKKKQSARQKPQSIQQAHKLEQTETEGQPSGKAEEKVETESLTQPQVDEATERKEIKLEKTFEVRAEETTEPAQETTKGSVREKLEEVIQEMPIQLAPETLAQGAPVSAEDIQEEERPVELRSETGQKAETESEEAKLERDQELETQGLGLYQDLEQIEQGVLPVAEEQSPATIELKDEIDKVIVEHGENPTGFIPATIVKEKVDEAKVSEAVDEATVFLENQKAAPQEKTILAKLRERVKKKALVYAGVGLMTLMAWKSELHEQLPKVPSNIVEALDKIPDIKVITEFPQMVASEAVRYRVAPYLAARYLGSNDYFGLEMIKAANTVGLKDKAKKMYETSLDNYINNFSETRQINRFTTLDKHTVRNYMDAFVHIYAGQEQSDLDLETYQKFKGFLQDNFGAAKAYEFALKVNSEENLSAALSGSSQEDVRNLGSILRSAAGKSNIYFNQEEGIFNVIHSGRLIDTYASRAGFMNVPTDGSKYFKSLGYGRTPDGTFGISSVERGYSTLRWKDSFLPHGAEIRLGESSREIEYKYNDGKWYAATGFEATYFDQGNKIQPNKLEKDLRYLIERSRGELPLTKLDFITPNGLMPAWDKNPFGPISYKLAGHAELIHSNPNDSDSILHPSHGCIRLDEEDVKVLEKYLGAGTSKIRISSKAGEFWKSVS